jgi:uncharacterized membrane protein YkgB
MQTAIPTKTLSSASLLPDPGSSLRSAVRRFVLRAGEPLTRGGLVLVISWIGGMKFTSYEAEGISAFVKHSPFMSWMYHVLSVREFSAGLGVAELSVAAGLLLGAFIPRVGIWAALESIAMFTGTLTFLVTTPGSFEPTLGGFPALSALPGQFLIKDFALLGASVWLLAASLSKCDEARASLR